ncbi:MAG: hypothetical protein JSW44_01925 [Candidatus Bathyarchaeota archaeon]|nr:MAG: hypothetical protein JSW44_01925 [Candidatus Bathyarchaeota archaeon]
MGGVGLCEGVGDGGTKDGAGMTYPIGVSCPLTSHCYWSTKLNRVDFGLPEVANCLFKSLDIVVKKPFAGKLPSL